MESVENTSTAKSAGAMVNLGNWPPLGMSPPFYPSLNPFQLQMLSLLQMPQMFPTQQVLHQQFPHFAFPGGVPTFPAQVPLEGTSNLAQIEKTNEPVSMPLRVDFNVPPALPLNKKERIKGKIYLVKGARKRWDGRRFARCCVVNNCIRLSQGTTPYCKAHGGGGSTPMKRRSELRALKRKSKRARMEDVDDTTSASSEEVKLDDDVTETNSVATEASCMAEISLQEEEK